MTGKILEGKVVLVTGAGNGIGAEIAKLAARQGARVVVNDLGASQFGEGDDTRPAQRVVDEIKAAGGEAVPSFHSIASWNSAHAIIDDALNAFGRLDGVVNNAGILRDVIFHKMTEDDWQSVIDVTLSGYFYVSRAAANHFKNQEGGAFVHMTSTSGLIGNRAQVNYGAAKMGVAGLSKCIALDMERFKVRSNCIAPFAYTRMTATIPEDTEVNKARVAVLKRMTADKIAPLTVALLSDQAADVTGQVFAARNNELVLFTQHRPLRTTQTSDGWTPESCLETALPALRPSMYPLDISSQVFTWDPF
ncbi:SDR family NAD(P)-dependent oxidoreductase [Sphingobium sp. EM0848]|uniref:SDR family NAD(P)-dependent oxidoreductase n=1 Tax=Sphingobium sp. EM0848 TaxID=2743473 RepID=UPI00159C8DC3|nr:SDR family NAD(P)-dependent oxidoreductase [Sphingobium sp. EM0848]